MDSRQDAKVGRTNLPMYGRAIPNSVFPLAFPSFFALLYPTIVQFRQNFLCNRSMGFLSLVVSGDEKLLKQLVVPGSASTGLKPGVNENGRTG
jgi:hypothetical protein